MNSVHFFVPKLPMSLNVMLRTTWAKRDKEQEAWDMCVYAEWLRHKKMMFFKPVRVAYVIVFAEDRARDIDNYIGGTKFATDSLKRTFFTKDNYKWLKSVSVEFDIGKTTGTWIFIEEVE